MIVFAFLFVFAVLYGLWCFTIRKGMKGLGCTRAFSKSAVFPGEEAELVEIVRNDSASIIPWLLVESKVSRYLRLGKQDNLHISGDTHYCSQFTLMPYQQIKRRHRVRFLHRGSYNLGSASLTAGDILGLYKYRRLQELDVPVLVYPQLIDDRDLPMPMSNHLQQITRQPQLLQDPFLIRGIRSYQPGDPVRDIHWAATARTGEVQIRVHDYSARAKLLVVLNAQILEKQWDDRLPEEHTPRIEYGISLAATACIKGLREGMSVGFATNMPVDTQKESIRLLPSDGNGWEETLLTTFARLTIVRTDHFLQFLESLKGCSGMDILILSAYDSDGIQSAMQKLQQNDNRVMLQLLEGGSL